NKKSFFSLLGVSFYLTKEQFEATLESIAELSSDGSTLVFDYADEGLFDSGVKRVRNMLAMAAAGGEPMKSCFSYNELEKLLERHGFLIYELLTSPDIQSTFFDGHGGMTAFENINYVTAVYK
ncbi:MAG: class I SAM-dependent methyltransferase, partial [Acutalibacteraceae bacterium]